MLAGRAAVVCPAGFAEPAVADAIAALRDCLDEYQNPIPEKTMMFQIGLAVKEASDLAFVPPAYRHLASQ